MRRLLSRVLHWIQLLLAALFVLGFLNALVLLAAAHLSDAEVRAAAPWMFLATPVAVYLAFKLFQRPGTPMFPDPDPAQEVAELEAAGLLERETFRARRAFAIEETEDEGAHLVIELEDGSSLLLNGQFLNEVCPPACGADDPFLRFPCRTFTLRRHRTEGHVVDVVCGEDPLGIEALAPPFSRAELEAHESDEVVRSPRAYVDWRRELLEDRAA